MQVTMNLSREVYDYFSDYDMSQVADTLLEMFDFTALPQKSPERYKEVRINVSNAYYISLYEELGPRSKKVSLSRLFDYAQKIDVLSMPRFELFRVEKENPAKQLVGKAYRAMLEACKYDNDELLTSLKDATYKYWRSK